MLSQAKLNNTIKLRHGLSAGDKFSVLLIPHGNLQQAVRFLKHMVWPNVTHLSLLARITLVIKTKLATLHLADVLQLKEKKILKDADIKLYIHPLPRAKPYDMLSKSTKKMAT